MPPISPPPFRGSRAPESPPPPPPHPRSPKINALHIPILGLTSPGIPHPHLRRIPAIPKSVSSLSPFRRSRAPESATPPETDRQTVALHQTVRTQGETERKHERQSCHERTAESHAAAALASGRKKSAKRSWVLAIFKQLFMIIGPPHLSGNTCPTRPQSPIHAPASPLQDSRSSHPHSGAHKPGIPHPRSRQIRALPISVPVLKMLMGILWQRFTRNDHEHNFYESQRLRVRGSLCCSGHW